MTQNYYEVLGCGDNCSKEQIIAEYRARSLVHDPDRSGSPALSSASHQFFFCISIKFQNNFQEIVLVGTDNSEQFIRLNEAYETLVDPAKRRQYDIYLKYVDIPLFF